MRNLFFILLFLFFGAQAFASDFLEGKKHFLVDDSGEVVDFLLWAQINSPAPKPLIKYKREKHFGRWIDFPFDDTCLTTRGIVLDRDTLVPIKTYKNYPCYVGKGFWYDPYTDASYSLAYQVEIDHVVPLKNAYLSGAWQWSWRKRCSYFNDLGNKKHLMPIESKTNTAKLDHGPERWMPPNKKYHCDYLTNWLRVKAIWQLRISENEAEAIEAIVKERHCNLDKFKITKKELQSHRQIMIQTANDCPADPPKEKK